MSLQTPRGTALIKSGHYRPAVRNVLETALRFDRDNSTLQYYANQLKGAKQSQGPGQTQFMQAQMKLLVDRVDALEARLKSLEAAAEAPKPADADAPKLKPKEKAALKLGAPAKP